MSKNTLTTLVLLPGLDGSGDFFDALCRQLPPQWRTHVVPYPGDQPLSYSELARFVFAALPDDGPFVLVAESFSGPVAIQVAATRPAGLIGVVLCATFARNPRSILRPLLGLTRMAPVRAAPMGLLSRCLLGAEADASWAERIRQAMGKCSVAVLRARAREVLLVDVRSQLADIRVPVLYLQASRWCRRRRWATCCASCLGFRSPGSTGRTSCFKLGRGLVLSGSMCLWKASLGYPKPASGSDRLAYHGTRNSKSGLGWSKRQDLIQITSD